MLVHGAVWKGITVPRYTGSGEHCSVLLDFKSTDLPGKRHCAHLVWFSQKPTLKEARVHGGVFWRHLYNTVLILPVLCVHVCVCMCMCVQFYLYYRHDPFVRHINQLRNISILVCNFLETYPSIIGSLEGGWECGSVGEDFSNMYKALTSIRAAKEIQIK